MGSRAGTLTRLVATGDEETGPLSLRAVDGGAALWPRVRVGGSFAVRFVGLMGRRGLAAGEGLYLPETGSIHMLFMRFAIDCIFLDRPAGDGTQRVLAVYADLAPWRGVVWYVRGAGGALEVAAGTARRMGVQPGDVVRLEAASSTTR
jgi:uncharacterized membrane protein (UPF0127 family)